MTTNTKSDELSAGVSPGDVLAGKYQVERVLGVGGMGVVVAAHHMQLEERVAIKFLLPESLGNPEAVNRFVREARAAVKIKGEHVARVFDVGTMESGAPYIVMEYLEGVDLSEWLKRRGALPLDQAVDFLLQACEAIGDAHALGIVHRDLKPANLFCVRRSDGKPSIKVLDFGISKITTPGAAGHNMTRTSSVVGSPYYMSPEQMQSAKAVDGRTDIWSLGIILFELLVGNAPFVADSIMELAVKISTEPPPSLRLLRGEVPQELEQLITTCLAKDRERRFQTVGDLALALSPFASPDGRASAQRVIGTLRQAGIQVGGELGRAATVLDGGTAVAASTLPTASAWEKSGARAPVGPTSHARRATLAIGSVLVMASAAYLLFRADPRGAEGQARAQATVAPRGVAEPIQPVEPPAHTAAPVVSVTAIEAPLPEAPTERPKRAEAVQQSGAMLASQKSAGAPARPVEKGATLPAAAAVALPVAPPPTPAAPPPHAPAAAKPNCTPPYVIDSSGDRVYKPECL